MTNVGDRRRDAVIERPLGTLGLVLIGLTAWGVERLQTRSGLAAIPARLVLAAVAAVGWAVDRLARSGSGREFVNGTAKGPVGVRS
jgi:hypothetical protein